MNPDKPSKVRTGEELDAAQLSQFLKTDIVDITQFPGGFSNLTYLLTTADGAELVLRRPPYGANIKSGHDMNREFRVLTLLENSGFRKIPKPLSIEASGAVLGAPFYVMQRLNGVILRAKDATNPTLTADKMAFLSEKLIENLVELHALDIETSGLNQLGKPEGYVRRQVEGWTKRYETAATDDLADMKIAADWLRDFAPRTQKPTFLHNDYKFDNVVWNTDLTAIIGVLDWEMSTVGDPLMDVGAALGYWCEPTDGAFTRMFNLSWLAGSPTRQQFAERYAALSGRDVSDIHFYVAFGFFKNAVILQQIYTRWKHGLTADARFEQLIHGVFELAKMARQTIETGKI